MHLAPKTRILLAVASQARARMQRALAGHDLTVVPTAGSALSVIEEKEFGFVIIGVHFDESRMFALLGEIRAHRKGRRVPILCVRDRRSRFVSGLSAQGLDHAVKAMSAIGFLDLQRFTDDEAGDTRIRRAVEHLIAIECDVQRIERATAP